MVTPPKVHDGLWATVDVTALVRARLAARGGQRDAAADAATSLTLAIAREMRRKEAPLRPADSTADGAVQFDSAAANLKVSLLLRGACP